MPTAFLRFDENMQSLFTSSAKDPGSWFFLSGYHGEDSYHSAGRFANYGYDFDSKYSGWMMGARWQAIADEQQKLAISVGVTKGTLSLTPQARDGASSGKFDTLSIHSLLVWQHRNGLTLDMPLGYGRYRGDVSTALRGKVASPSAKSWNLGLNVGKGWQYGDHRITPVMGMFWQHLNIDDFRDRDGTNVSYNMQRTPHYSGGVKYDFEHRLNRAGQLRLGSDLRLIRRPGKANRAIVGDEKHSVGFDSGRGGDSVQLKTDASLALAENMELTSQFQYQKRLGREGVDDWFVTGGLKVRF